MTIWIAIGCNHCPKKRIGLAFDTDIDAWLDAYGWDADPAWGHRCAKCIRKQAIAEIAEPSSDDLLTLETTVEEETVDCRHCAQPIFWATSERVYGSPGHRDTRKLSFNAKPHHCGFAVEEATFSAEGSTLIMGERYFKIGTPHPQGKSTYPNHVCRKSDINALKGSAEVERRREFHGWSFMNYPDEINAGIRHYIETGELSDALKEHQDQAQAAKVAKYGKRAQQ